MMERLGIGGLAHQKVTEMSVGEQQRLSIIRAVINQPKLILADEPTSALDDHHCGEVVKMLDELNKELNAALLIVTHDQRIKNFIHQYIEL
ncbi:unnamed protein product, partial [Cyprideis torosa]